MSIEKFDEGWPWTVTCDKCDEELETSADDFYGAKDEAKSYGWTSIMVNGEWENHCPSCSN